MLELFSYDILALVFVRLGIFACLVTKFIIIEGCKQRLLKSRNVSLVKTTVYRNNKFQQA